MPTPTDEFLRERLNKSTILSVIARKYSHRIFEDILRGDELIDEVQEYMTSQPFLSLDDPDLDIRTECKIIDEVWYRIMHQLAENIRETQR